MKKLLLIPLLLFCVTAFGQWTKPQLYENINTNIRLKSYSPTRISAVLDSIVATMNTGAGSVDTTAFIKTQGTSILTDDITIDYSGVTQYARIYMDSSQINIEQVDTLADSRSILSFNSYGLNFSTSDIAFTGAGALFTEKDSAAVVYTDFGGDGFSDGIVAKRDSTNVYGPVYLKRSLIRNDTLNQILARDFTTGRLKYVSKNALTGSSWPLTGSATLTGNVDIDAGASNYDITLGSTNMIGGLGLNAMGWSIGDYTNAVGGAAIQGGPTGILLRDYSSSGIQMNVGGALFYFDPTGDISIATRYLGSEALLSKSSNQLTLNGTGVNNSVIINAASPATTDRTWTIPDLSGDQTFVGLTGAQTLTTKTIALGSNTVSGSLAEFNTALTGADFASGGGTATGTNTGDQALANTSDATSHTVTLTGGTSFQLIEGSNITLTTGGTGGVGTVTIASTGGGGGITNGAAANEIMKSDGTNAVASGIESTTAGNIALGLSGTSGATRTIQAAGSASDVAIQVLAKGASDATLGSVGTGKSILTAGGGWLLSAWNFTSGTVVDNAIQGNSTSSTNANNAGDVTITGGGTTSTVANQSGNVVIKSGLGNGTNSSSGSVSLASNAVTGSGTEGSVNIQTRTTGKIGFFNATPVIKQSAVTTNQGVANVLTTYGLLPTSNVNSIEDDVESTTSRTLDNDDNGKIIYFTNSSAITVTLPTGLADGFNVILLQDGTGTISITTSGTTLNGSTASTGQYSTLSLVNYKATDTYIGK